MADKSDKRPWYLTTRMLGVGITVSGVAMWFVPVTKPIADEFIKAGLALIAGGQYSASMRKTFNGNAPAGDKSSPPVAKNATTEGK
jgi:hypothetical protein